MNNSDVLKRAILRSAIALSKEKGFKNFSRAMLAKRAGAGEATVSYHYGPMDDLREAVMSAAIEQEIIEIVAQGLALNDSLAKSAPEALKRKAARLLVA